MVDDDGNDSEFMTCRDAEYFRLRESRERHMARHARCRNARAAHQRLASFYADRYVAIAPTSPQPKKAWRSFQSLLRRFWG